MRVATVLVDGLASPSWPRGCGVARDAAREAAASEGDFECCCLAGGGCRFGIFPEYNASLLTPRALPPVEDATRGGAGDLAPRPCGLPGLLPNAPGAAKVLPAPVCTFPEALCCGAGRLKALVAPDSAACCALLTLLSWLASVEARDGVRGGLFMSVAFAERRGLAASSFWFARR